MTSPLRRATSRMVAKQPVSVTDNPTRQLKVVVSRQLVQNVAVPTRARAPSLFRRAIRSALAQLISLAACAPAQAVDAAPVSRPSKPAPSEQASRYMLSLINRDRKAAGLSPLSFDPIASTGAAKHARDMAAHGYTAHWGTD